MEKKQKSNLREAVKSIARKWDLTNRTPGHQLQK